MHLIRRQQAHTAPSPPPDLTNFVAFYRSYRDLVLAFFLRRTADPELAADLMMEVFAAALLASRRGKRPDDPGAWLFGIARNKLTDSYRRGAAESAARVRLAMQPVEVDDDDIERVNELTDESRIVDLLEQLPAAQREAVRAHVMADESYAEIARALGTSPLVIRKRVSRGLGRLKTHVQETL